MKKVEEASDADDRLMMIEKRLHCTLWRHSFFHFLFSCCSMFFFQLVYAYVIASINHSNVRGKRKSEWGYNQTDDAASTE